MKKKELFELSKQVNLRFLTPSNYNNFFGYYYKSPLCAEKKKLLAHRIGIGPREISSEDKAEIGYYDLDSGEWFFLGLTNAINWQIGSMLQWIGPDHSESVIYNDYEDKIFVSKIINIKSKKTQTIKFPIYDVNNTGTTALGVIFERLYFTREYHYKNIKNEKWNISIHPDDGIYAVDLSTGNTNCIIRTSNIAKINPTDEMINSANWLCHINWNPSGDKFLFLHRYGNKDFYRTRVFIYNLINKEIFCLPDHEKYNYSHTGWKNDDEFVVFLSELTKIASMHVNFAYDKSFQPKYLSYLTLYKKIKKLLPDILLKPMSVRSGYGLFKVGSNEFNYIANRHLRNDGHPSWTSDGKYMITDTYSDSAGYRHLLKYNFVKKKVCSLGKFYSPYNESNFRCDLHPRVDYSNEYIIIDTAHSGKRQVMVIEQ